MSLRCRPAGLVVALLLLAGCSAPPAPTSAALGCVPAPAATTQFRYARNVAITPGPGYRVLTVRQPYPGAAPQSLVLLSCDAPDPALPPALAGASVLRSPVAGVFSGSTTQLPFVTELGALDRLTGVADPALVSDPAVRARIDAGGVTTFAAGGITNAEQVIAAAPGVLLSQGTDDPAFPALRAAGIPVVGWADYLESGPLAQAEWIKVMGALTGRDAEAAAAFDAIARRYTDLAARARGQVPTPIVAGQPYQGTWNVPAGGSTAGALFRDAGASWSAASTSAAGTLPRSLEAVLAADGGARTWLADGPWRTTADVASADPRLPRIAAAGPGGQVWTRDKLLGPGGGNQIYERGVAHPDEVLADLVAILHPQLLPGHGFVYYRRVPTG
ncbi:ABC transporter substrate-binding protein [Pseudonocardia sp. KRD291]|uniref:ABC transporter substrate-binding protein n=1 Tax=Pseudonocardia sp. KRD291 TaxID=2792007 RepID=UPI001C4A3A0C|nr:ABC transporter substrate-binding protein [Pseudonocardia sp. KRD291]MBW0105329.1 ABC transporter substrate-binding protein [Pseudonocardia sp. KRD291]